MAEKFFFAYTTADEAFDPAVHNVEDENVFAFTFSQDEGDFAQVVFTIINPRIGLLAPGRKVWVWFSWDQSLTDTPDIVALFKGRLVALPDNLFDQTVDLTFTAKPNDFLAQKATLAATMRDLPYWDSVFIAPTSWADDDTVLEARSELWHIDPVTHVVTSSDIINGDTTIEFFEADFFYDAVAVSLQGSPVSSVTMQATIPWTQSASGIVDFTSNLLGIGGGEKYQMISSFTFQGLVDDWPKQGGDIGDGWIVTTGELVDQSLLSVPRVSLIPGIFDTSSIVPVPDGSIIFPVEFTGTTYGGVDGSSIEGQDTIVVAPIGYGVPSLAAQYTRSVTMGQTITFTLNADMQKIMTDDEADETLALSLSGNAVSDLTFDNTIPMVDVSGRDYIHTARGVLSIEYLIMFARANLLAKARAIKIDFTTTLANGFAASLRKSGLIHDPRLPGGQAIGKFISYSHALSGDDGTPLSTLTIACAIGYGGSFTGDDGTGAWVNDAYVDPAYQEHTGKISVTPTSDIQFALPTFAGFDDGLVFAGGLTKEQAIQELNLLNPSETQRTDILANTSKVGDNQAIASLLGTMPTQFTLQLAPMSGGPFQQEVAVSLSDLVVPQQINLEAESV